jgi:DNA (cytosine-5)-methyltransferase 1
MRDMVTLASLFDGIGGAPLCATLCGAVPLWSSEIEPIPISITKRHFPDMKHYGDITKINGAAVEPVDIIVGGSPCQDLSVAGKRAGLEGARSGLFMEQIRIVKEMRDATKLRIERRPNTEMGRGSDSDNSVRKTGVCGDDATNGIQPRFMVWENVPGAFSSNNGEDFRIVLEETARVADPTIRIPRCEAWSNAGSILGDGFSVSWRILDAQYWGVPQRRRRIYLVADFGGQSAPEILFEREGLSGDFAKSGAQGQRTAEDAERCVGSAGFKGNQGSKAGGIGFEAECAPTVLAGQECHVVCFEPGAITRDIGSMIGRADNNGPQGSGVNEDVSFTLNTTDRHAVCYNGENITSPTNAQNPKPGDPCHTLGTDSRNYVCYGISAYESNSMKSSNPHSGIYEADTARTIDQNGGNPACNQGGIAVVNLKAAEYYENHPQDSRVTGPHDKAGAVVKQYGTGGGNTPLVLAHGQGHAELCEDLSPTLNCNHEQPIAAYTGTVRRLTPIECERLQGFPDNWTNINGASDSARYKALGNSFAIPCALFVIQGCVDILRDELGVTE